MNAWPTTLPTPSDASGQYASLIDNVIETSVETGAPKRRRRFTAVPDSYTGALQLTSAQVTTLDTFVKTTLGDVLPFTWIDFRTGVAATYTFKKRPTYSRVQASRTSANPHGLWSASLELTMKP